MKIKEEQAKEIIKEETQKYLEEIRALDPELFQKVMKHIPFTKQHRQTAEKENARRGDTDVYMMVIGGPRIGEPYDNWPDRPDEKDLIVNWLVNVYPDISKEQALVLRWPVVQHLVRKAYKKDLRKMTSGQSLAETIKEEVVKYLKENE